MQRLFSYFESIWNRTRPSAKPHSFPRDFVSESPGYNKVQPVFRCIIISVINHKPANFSVEPLTFVYFPSSSTNQRQGLSIILKGRLSWIQELTERSTTHSPLVLVCIMNGKDLFVVTGSLVHGFPFLPNYSCTSWETILLLQWSKKNFPAPWQWAWHPPVWEPVLPPCSTLCCLPVRWVLPTPGSYLCLGNTPLKPVLRVRIQILHLQILIVSHNTPTPSCSCLS